ncbi:unnamed protein product, partial [Rotaria sordida]
MHPISNTFRIYYDSDFERQHIKSEIPKLTDCLGNTRLYFSPASAFANGQVECTIVFKARDGHFYFAPYAFVRRANKGFKFENSTVFDLEKDANDDEFFSLEMIICKLKNNMFESNDKQEHNTCQIKRFPCGTVVNIDHKLLSLWGINEKEKKMNKNAKPVTPNKLAKLLNSYTAHIVFRRTHWDPVEKQFVSEPEILFCSNAFTPVNGSVRVHQYDYSPNKLKIKKLILSRISSLQNINQYNLQVSCIAKILTSSEHDSRIHPNYKFMDGQKPVDSILIRVDQYDSTLTFTVIKRTVEEWETDFILNQGLPVSSSNISKFIYSEKPIASSSPANDNLTDETIDQASTHVKRSFEKEPQERTGSISKYLCLQANDCKEKEYEEIVDLLSVIDYGFYKEQYLPNVDPNLTFEEERNRLAEAIKQYAFPNILKGLRELRQKRIKHKSNKENQDWIKCETKEDKIVRTIWKTWCHERECRPRAGIILLCFDTHGLAEILLTKYYKNNYIQYGYAKGEIELSETIWDCAAREGAEELGLDAKIIYNLIKHSQPIKKNVFNVLENSSIEHYYFIIRVPNKNIDLIPNEEEIHGIVWHDVYQLPCCNQCQIKSRIQLEDNFKESNYFMVTCTDRYDHHSLV